jgi:hypothetical protein
MKIPNAPIPLLFQDRPLPETPTHTRRSPSLYRACLEYNDPIEMLLRVLLVLCLLISLAVCLRQAIAPSAEMLVQPAARVVATAAPNDCQPL